MSKTTDQYTVNATADSLPRAWWWNV